ncbi:MAG TPA: VRR-NUC domain-containing protein [Planctomycetota bacterium]|nr:VRR-NUC domain-containing protein [Planctomycetota bacterium]HRR82919.1 VRR-NUC domain-containing protein [Planctomycetota bacterium]HRT95773.1 VRR-NUC domain-containing protein [Planctomycetota bacterium]
MSRHKIVPIEAIIGRARAGRRDERHEELVNACLTVLNVTRLGGERIFAWRNDTGIVRDADGRVRRRYGTAGAGDILAVLPPLGRLLVVEVKTGSGRVSAKQRDFHARIIERGGLVFGCRDDVGELQAFLAWLRHQAAGKDAR